MKTGTLAALNAGDTASDWTDIRPGDLVEIETAFGYFQRREVESISDKGNVVWLAADGPEGRKLVFRPEDRLRRCGR